jgi:hypothetical protein
MLNHAFHKNMDRATLIAGDLDFQPVVESLIYHGTFVTVCYGAKSGSKELYWSADANRVLTISDYCNFSSPEFQRNNETPTVMVYAGGGGSSHTRVGFDGTTSVCLYFKEERFHIADSDPTPKVRHVFRGVDPHILTRLYRLHTGRAITWTPALGMTSLETPCPSSFLPTKTN